MFRLYIDIPIDLPETEEAVAKAKKVLSVMMGGSFFKENIFHTGVEKINYRLSNDEDRTLKNYFHINENGHAGTKKDCLLVENYFHWFQ